MTPFRSDFVLYRLMSKGPLVGYVDDLLRARSSELKSVPAKTHDRFDMGDDETLPCTLCCFHLSLGEGNCLEQDQNFYLTKLEHIPLDVPFSAFLSMCMILA